MLRKYPDVMNIEQMCDALRISTKTGYKLLHEGKIQLFCADSIDGESLLAGNESPRRRAEMQEKYFVYLTSELAARIAELNAPERKEKPLIWCVGVDTGAYQAVQCRLRRPRTFAGAMGLSGLYDIGRFLGSAEDDLVLRSSPLAASVSL